MHRPLTVSCLSLIWAPADAAATRHTRAPTCMAARMREGTQAHTASCMSAFPRAPAQARHGCGMSRRTSYRAPFADGHFVVRVRGRGRRGGTARRLLRRLRRLEYFVRLFSLPSSRGLSRGAHPSFGPSITRRKPGPIFFKKKHFKKSARREERRAWDVGGTWAGRARDITHGRSRACCRPALSARACCRPALSLPPGARADRSATQSPRGGKRKRRKDCCLLQSDVQGRGVRLPV